MANWGLIWDGQYLVFEDCIIAQLPLEVIEILEHGTNSQRLDALALLALDPRWTTAVYTTYEPLFVDLCNRWLWCKNERYLPLKIVAALARVLPFAQHLSMYAEEVMIKRKLGLFEVIYEQQIMGLHELPQEDLFIFLYTMIRLLEFDNHTFSPIIFPVQLQVLLSHPQRSIRYLAIKVLCLFLHAADAAFHEIIRSNVGNHVVEGPWEDIFIDYRFWDLWEEKRLGVIKHALSSSRLSEGTRASAVTQIRVVGFKDLFSSTACFAGVLVPATSYVLGKQELLVMTKTTVQNLRSVVNAMLDPRPLLVTGLSGSGKTSIIRHIAQYLDTESTMLTLHLNEQTDAKLLVGTYSSTSNPGSFAWRPGVLTTAVMDGRWILVEDLDRAPIEILSTLLPLLDRGELIVPTLGGPIKASRGFKLIATLRSSLNTRQEAVIPGMNMLGIRHWNKVHLHKLSSEDLQAIISTRFPILHAHQSRIMGLYHRLSNQYQSYPSLGNLGQQPGRPCGPQDLIRYCFRLEKLLQSCGAISGDEPVSETASDNIFMEAVDCFTASLQNAQLRAEMIQRIAEELHVSVERSDYCLHTRIPSYVDGGAKLKIGRTTLQKRGESQSARISSLRTENRPFAITDHAVRVLESIGVAVKMNEPCLLVGETGTGKTTIIQELARSLGHHLVVINLSQQSEAGDLLGGYKPVNMRTLAMPMKDEFDDLFERTFSSQKNQRYIKSLNRTIARGEWSRVLTLWQEALKMTETTFAPRKSCLTETHEKPKKRRKVESPSFQKLKGQWDRFATQVGFFQQQLSGGSKGFNFSFVEGNIVKAVRNGHWVLLDEINLASPDTLESLADLLTDRIDDVPSLLLSETGNIDRIYAHSDFRIFGAMNPATDVGKRDLPSSLRSRFTEYYIESPDKDFDSLVQVIKAYLGSYVNNDIHVAHDIANLYLSIQQLRNDNRLVDGADQKPHFSLRTLTRTLIYVTDIAPMYGLRRALFEGFSMSFLTLLNRESELLVLPMIDNYLLSSQKNRRALLHQMPRSPVDDKDYVQFKCYWIAKGTEPIQPQPHYILTPFVESNLLNLVRATSTRRFPVLLQGPTSSGKTSMIEYLAKISGNKFVRINNHEHTDLQEYLGTYVSSKDGKLHYQEGILVRALREGHWIVLDELNLAPTDILEALNRLLDDNRELLIPETQQMVRPHENFMLFATQNPPGLYGGRKVLSRAFRNRFLELHFDDIPENELETILRERSQIAPSFCTKIVAVYKKLVILRQSGRLFEQKNSFATLRDLFRWALRDADDREQLAANGFMLLAERVRKPEERLAVKEVIEDVLKVKIDESRLYSPHKFANFQTLRPLLSKASSEIVWTKSMRRLYVLVQQALKINEPVLLVGETGCGKTSICQVIADVSQTELHIVNAHQNTETGDLIGSQRPLRNRVAIESQLVKDLIAVLDDTKYAHNSHDTLSDLLKAYNSLSIDALKSCPTVLLHRIQKGVQQERILFEWSDGSLVQSMKAGHYFLLDEISLADDSVLERLNSVLESDRTLLLAEKGPDEALVTAAAGFQFLATMNPGGDYGKKELSPALRNRFTEIWVPPLIDAEEVLEIVRTKLIGPLVNFAEPMVEFSTWYGTTYNESKTTISLREILAWVRFVNSLIASDPFFSLLHGAAMVYIDRLGANPAAKLSIAHDSIPSERRVCISILSKLFEHDMASIYDQKPLVSMDNALLHVGPFELFKFSSTTSPDLPFSVQAPTTVDNAMRIVRALRVRKPLLIEGNPGVGKTAIVSALARMTGVQLTRINLSEQTDIMDLFGSDVPIEGGEAGQFAWRDAPFLRAMQRGEWVLLDEMNLASQSVLEGLNACLDHRGQVYVPELDQTFTCHPEFTLFATQNPHHQGGGRKGLPASFVNRFTVVYADTLRPTDLSQICNQLYSSAGHGTIESSVDYVTRLSSLLERGKGIATNGGPWEFNLRDIFRWLSLLNSPQPMMQAGRLEDYEDLVFLSRFRTSEDITLISNNTDLRTLHNGASHHYFHNISSISYQCRLGYVMRSGRYAPQIPNSFRPDLRYVESAMLSVQQNWPCLLVGPSGSGKTNLIYYVGSIVGADITELPMTTDMDTIDLVGGYNQVDTRRRTSEIMLKLRPFIHKRLIQDSLSASFSDIALTILDALHEKPLLEIQRLYELLCKLAEECEHPELHLFTQECRTIIEQASQDGHVRFEWVDGILVKALEQGQWLILDNANLCSPSVLDRLNALLEPQGVLAVNEHRSSDGSIKVIKPHPDFRIFLTVDPRHGELSRAMRNRCIELFMHDPDSSRSAPLTSALRNSSTYRFQVFQRLEWDSLNDGDFRSLVALCCDHLSFSDLEICKDWLYQVEKGLLQMPIDKVKLLAPVLKTYLQLASQGQGVLESVLQLYQKASHDRFGKKFPYVQTVHPLNNPTLLSLPTDGPLMAKATSLAILLEASKHLLLLEKDIIMIGNSVGQKSAAQMSRLERSMASDRILAFSKDSTHPLSTFISCLQRSLLTWIDKEVSRSSYDHDALKMFQGICYYLQDIFEYTQRRDFEDGVFQAYLGIGKTLASNASQHQQICDAGKALSTCLGKFNSRWELSTGNSMGLLWKYFKPWTAKNLAQQDLLLQIEGLADEFDGIAWQSSGTLAVLSRLRESLTTIYSKINKMDDSAESHIQATKNALNQIENEVGDTAVVVYPYFQEAFEGLNQLFGLFGNKHHTQKPLLELAASRSTRSCLRVGQPTAATNLLLRIQDSTAGLVSSRSLMPLRNIIPISILKKTLNAVDVPLQALDLLCQEVRLLTQSTASASDFILEDQYLLLNTQLAQLHKELYQIHSAYFDSQALEACIQHLELFGSWSPTQPAFSLPILHVVNPAESPITQQLQAVLEEYLAPSLQQMTSACFDNEKRLQETAAAWIFFFLACLVLYVPDRPFDPALRPKIELEHFNKRKLELQQKLAMLRQYEEASTGQRTNLRCEIVEQELEALGIQPVVPDVFRPDASGLEQLQGEFNNILNSIVHRSPDEQRLQTVFLGEKAAVKEMQLLRQNISRVAARLSSRFRGYDDIVRPVVGFLSGLDIGLKLALMVEHRNQEVEKSTQFVIKCTPLQGLRPETLRQISFSDLITTKNSNVEPRITYLRLVSLEQDVVRSLHPASADVVLDVFQNFYEDWKQQLMNDQDEYTAKTSLYRYRGGQDKSDEAEHEEFRQLFPEYGIVSETDLAEDTKLGKGIQASASKIADLQQMIFGDRNDTSMTILSMIQDASQDIAKLWTVDLDDCLFPVPSAKLLPSVILVLDSSSRDLLQSTEPGLMYSFYTDRNLSEARKIVDLAQKIALRFRSIKEHWPEHATIDDVLCAANELLAFRHIEPIAKILTKCEQLHGYIHEWQIVASREYSALDLYNELTDTLISWRRLELSTWARLLDIEDDKCSTEAKAWWFVAYEVIIAATYSTAAFGESLSKHVQELFKTLEDFFHTTSVGQYSHRIRLIKVFEDHVGLLMKKLPSLGMLRRALVNFVSYHKRFEIAIHEALSKHRKSLEKNIKEVILLASWKDTNIAALRESAKRSHHKLFKIVRKYRAYLDQPVEMILKNGLPENNMSKTNDEPPTFQQQNVTVNEIALQVCKDQIDVWETRDYRYRNPIATVSKMLRMSTLPTSIVVSSSFLDTFSTNLMETIQVLRKETPSMLTTENKTMIKHLKSRKRKLFSDTLKEIRVMGFKSNLGADILGKQSSLGLVLASTQVLNGRTIGKELSDLEYFFHKSLENLTAIRLLTREHSDELTGGEVSRSLGFLEDILHIVIKQRDLLGPTLIEHDVFDSVIKKMQNLWAPEKYTIQQAIEQENLGATSVERCVRWLPVLLDVSHLIIEKHNNMANHDSTPVLNAIVKWRSRFQTLSRDYDDLPQQISGLSTSLHDQVYQNADAMLGKFSGDLKELYGEYPIIGFVLKQIEPWTLQAIAIQNPGINGAHSATIDDIEKQMKRTIDKMLVGIQRMQQVFSDAPSSNEENGWFIRAASSLMSSVRALQVDSISTELTTVMSLLQYLSPGSSSVLELAAALCTTALPIIQTYKNVHKDVLRQCLHQHGSLCRILCTLTTAFKQLVAHGFCSPSEKSTEEGKSKNVEEGTGLGDGEGAEDISKDIQDDEDLSELAQQGAQDKSRGEIEDQEDAIDMQQDELEGELGDAEDGEKDGSDGAQSEDEGNEIDEEVGGVDELDPSAVDEKLWDGSEQHDQKEKESDDSKGKKRGEMNSQNDSQYEKEKDAGDQETANETGADEGEEVGFEKNEKLDPHLQEEQNLDLPEEMDLDGDKDSISTSDCGDLDDMSNADQDELSDGDEKTGEFSKDEEELPDIESIDEGKEDLNNDNKAERTEEAGSPIDTEPEDDVGPTDSLLRDRTDDAMVDQSNVAPSDSHGVDEQADRQESKNDSQGNNLQGAEGAKVNQADSEVARAGAEVGELSQANPTADAMLDQSEPAQATEEKNVFKKLGDALEKWHRQSQQIHNAPDAGQRDDSSQGDHNELDQEFEHVEDEDATTNAQALGAANADQATALDQRAQESGINDQTQDINMNDAESEPASEGMDDVDSHDLQQEAHVEKPRAGAAVSSESKSHELSNSRMREADHEEDIEELDNDLSTVHLESQDQATTRSPAEARRLWSHYENRTRDLSLSLTEQLRLVLAPTLATKMRGDFRTGKRLNIKRIIPYIASQYKRDKIWMRRSVPSKRNYQIMLAIDDSKSMGESGSGQLALETLTLVSKSLSMLEVGQVCIVGFGEDVQVTHAFDQTFSSEAGVSTFQKFGFQQTRTNVRKLIVDSIRLFRDARNKSSSSESDLWQLELIISDGVCEDHESIRRLVRQAQEERIMIVFVVIDALKGESIMEMTQATFAPDESGETKLKITRYLDGFPFGYYLIVGDVKELPGVLAAALRQWFTEVVESG